MVFLSPLTLIHAVVLWRSFKHSGNQLEVHQICEIFRVEKCVPERRPWVSLYSEILWFFWVL